MSLASGLIIAAIVAGVIVLITLKDVIREA